MGKSALCQHFVEMEKEMDSAADNHHDDLFYFGNADNSYRRQADGPPLYNSYNLEGAMGQQSASQGSNQPSDVEMREQTPVQNSSNDQQANSLGFNGFNG